MQARVLIVDDNPVVRKALRHLLEHGGSWEVSEAEDGQAGITRALELRPNVVVLDLVMPVMDGLNAAQEISQALPDTAIVMYTMHGSPILELEAQKRGVRKLVSKSQSRDLLSTVQQIIATLPPETIPEKVEPVAPIVLPDPTSLAVKPNQDPASPTSPPATRSEGKLAS